VLLEVEVEVLEDEVYALVAVHHVLQPAQLESMYRQQVAQENEPMCRGESMEWGANLTMFRCCISLRREISRMAVDGTPSSSCSRRIFLSAIVSLVWRSLPLYTTPYVPSPIFSTFSYCAHTPRRRPHYFPAKRVGLDERRGGASSR
jgi:hypothetical protein